MLYAMDYPYQNEAFEVGMNEEALTDANRNAFWEDTARGCSTSTESGSILPIRDVEELRSAL